MPIAPSLTLCTDPLLSRPQHQRTQQSVPLQLALLLSEQLIGSAPLLSDLGAQGKGYGRNLIYLYFQKLIVREPDGSDLLEPLNNPSFIYPTRGWETFSLRTFLYLRMKVPRPQAEIQL